MLGRSVGLYVLTLCTRRARKSTHGTVASGRRVTDSLQKNDKGYYFFIWFLNFTDDNNTWCADACEWITFEWSETNGNIWIGKSNCCYRFNIDSYYIFISIIKLTIVSKIDSFHQCRSEVMRGSKQNNFLLCRPLFFFYNFFRHFTHLVIFLSTYLEPI